MFKLMTRRNRQELACPARESNVTFAYTCISKGPARAPCAVPLCLLLPLYVHLALSPATNGCASRTRHCTRHHHQPSSSSPRARAL
jgi:hypothetical protein